MMKEGAKNAVKATVAAGLLAVAAQSGAQMLCADSFDRSNTDWLSGDQLTALGGSWYCETPGKWKLIDGQLQAKMYTPQPTVLVNRHAVTETRYLLSVDCVLSTDKSSGFIGLVTHYQNPTEQYVFRFNGEGNVQFLVGNNSGAIVSEVRAFSHTPGRAYRMTIYEPQAFEFELTIQDLSTGQIVFSKQVIDKKRLHQGGFGGVHNSAGSLFFDNFLLQKINGPLLGGVLGTTFFDNLIEPKTSGFLS